MIGAFLLLVATSQLSVQDTLRVVTLSEALESALAVSPDYVRSVGQLENAEWGRRAARLTFFVPNVTASASYQQLSTSQFNIGIGQAANASGSASLDARYELFSGGRKWQQARQASAELDRAEAGELGARFLAALETERDYYGVLGARDLLGVARQRLARAESQFALARARVQGGATVQSDSLQLLLERQRAETAVLTSEAALTVARLQLGRRIGVSGPVDAAEPMDTAAAPLTMSLAEAIQYAVAEGPAWQQARASEKAAIAALKGQRGSYLPSLTLNATWSAFDNKFFPTATNRRAIGISGSWTLWNGGQRELQLRQLTTQREVARVVREDLERGARRDVTEAYTTFDVARRTLEIAVQAVGVAAEVLRVQESRYRAGASTVLELLDAQTQLAVAESDRVRAQYEVRLTRAGLEAILGTRLSPVSDPSRP